MRTTKEDAAIFEGTLDACTLSTLSGWCYNDGEPDEPVEVTVWVDHRFVATVSASFFREDLLRAGKGNGRHAFAFELAANLAGTAGVHSIAVKASDTQQDLDGSPAVFRNGKRVELLCYYPWTTLYVTHAGGVHTCAPSSFLRDKDASIVGDRRQQSLEEIWNGPVIRRYREAFLNNNYEEFCRPDICPFLGGVTKHTANEKVLRAVANRQTALDFGFSRLVHDLDMGCNLHCIMCRPRPVPADRPAVHEAVADIKRVARQGDLENLHVSGSGEPLFLDEFVDLLASDTLSSQKIEVSLNTNLTLLTPEVWRRIKHNELTILVSVDGASKATYEKVRRGSNWENVLERMRFLSERLALGEIKRVRLAYLITKSNVQDVGKIVGLARELGFLLIFYSQYGPLPTPEENIFESCNIEELDKVYDLILEAGGFDSPHVHLGSCGMLRDREYREFSYRMEMVGFQLNHHGNRDLAIEIADACLADVNAGVISIEPSEWKKYDALIAEIGPLGGTK